MKIKVYGKETYFYSEDGKELGYFNTDPKSSLRDTLAINAARLQKPPRRYDPEWFKKSYVERALPQYVEEITELCETYRNNTITDYINI